MERISLLCVSVGVAIAAVFAESDDADIVRPANEPGYSRNAYETGRRDAERDIHENRLVIEISGGPPAPWNTEWKRLLRERFQIEVREVASCIVDYQITGHERGYNEVSFAEIERRFGRDVIRETRQDAERHWHASREK